MSSVKAAAKRKRKVAPKPTPQRSRAKRGPTDYDDEVTKATIVALNRVVPDDDFDGYDTLIGPAW